jgi:hypothetical protein
MDNTPFSKQCEILNEMYHLSTEVEAHKTQYLTQFWQDHDMGLLVAKGVAERCFNVATPLGLEYLEETWLAFIHYMGCVDTSNFVDPTEYPTSFNSLQELFDYVEYDSQ